MNVGTKSVLYGAHAFWLHPFFVFVAWWKLYGFPWDPRLWLAFFVHDMGYWGRPNMDGPEGERHPEWGARAMTNLFDRDPTHHPQSVAGDRPRAWRCFFPDWNGDYDFLLGPWGQLALLHSRFYAKANQAQPSRLCAADKLAVALEPWWLYLPRVIASGEVREYMSLAAVRDPASKYAGEPPTKYESMGLDLSSRRAWFRNMAAYLRAWAYEHADGRPDTWTPDQREARDDSGVWS
jgi:hypothetical protein